MEFLIGNEWYLYIQWQMYSTKVTLLEHLVFSKCIESKNKYVNFFFGVHNFFIVYMYFERIVKLLLLKPTFNLIKSHVMTSV